MMSLTENTKTSGIYLTILDLYYCAVAYSMHKETCVRIVLPTFPSLLLSLSSNVFRMLRSMVLEPEQGPSRLRLLAAAILRELSPLQKTLVRDFTPPTDPQNIPFILPVLLAQVLYIVCTAIQTFCVCVQWSMSTLLCRGRSY